MLYGITVLAAVLWPSGGDVASMKNFLGPSFLSEAGKDIVLNLVMLAPLTAILTVAWPRVPWWAWALLGCLIGVGAEIAQALIPTLDRRPSPANAAQNAVGSWCGAVIGLIVSRLIERRHRARAARRRPSRPHGSPPLRAGSGHRGNHAAVKGR